MGFFGNVVSSFANSNPIGMLANLGSSVITNALNRHQQKETNKANAYQNELNRQFNAEQSELDRAFNSGEAQKSREFNANQALLSQQFNAEQSQKQMDFQKDMWNLENEYNSPASQMERLRAAGLNPNLFGGDNTAVSVGAGTAASSSPASSTPASHGSLGSGSSLPMNPFVHSNPLLESAQIKLANAQANKAMSDTDYNKAQIQRIYDLLAGEKEMQRLQIDSQKFDLEKMKPAELANLEAETKSLDKGLEVMDEHIKKFQQEVENLKQQHDYTAEQIRHIKIENDYLPSVLQSEIRKNIADACASDAQADLLSEQAANAILDGYMLQLDYDTKNKGHMNEVRIQREEQKYSLYKAKTINKHKSLFFTLDNCKELVGGVSRGVSSTMTRMFGGR